MKNLIIPSLLLIASTSLSAQETVSVDFKLTEMSIPAKDSINKFEAQGEMLFDYGEEAVLDKEGQFKAVFKITGINGKPNLDFKLFDYDDNQKVFSVGSIILNTNWEADSEFSWWHNAIKYTVVLTPKKSNA